MPARSSLSELRVEQDALREVHAGKSARPMLDLAEARARRTPIAWSAEDVSTPEFTGLARLDDVPLTDIVPFIDWTFFFHAWELRGRFPGVLDHPKYGPAARELFANANELLERITAERLLQARGVYGFWPANADGDDIVVFADDARTRELTRFPMLRQQREKPDGKPSLSSPTSSPRGPPGCATTSGCSRSPPDSAPSDLVERFEREHDDYSAIMVRAIADRLAEAFAEMLHQRVRRDWGYGAGRGPLRRRPRRGALPRDPPRVRLPGLPRPHGEAAALRPARRGRARASRSARASRCCRPRR